MEQITELSLYTLILGADRRYVLGIVYQRRIRKPPGWVSVLSRRVSSQVSVLQVVTMGLFRTIALFYLGSFDSIVRRCMMQKAKLETVDKTA